ncbi:MAG: hypothetical protein MUO24_09810, partial [Desulfobacterales bacterium]|nr:hypothetical protein [Desulfobacterales bacterium]
MDTAITISTISAIIAGCSFWVAYRAFLHSRESRKADKFTELRFQVVELRSTAEKFRYNSKSLSRSQPTKYDQDVSGKFDRVVDSIEELHKKMYEGPSCLSETDLNDMAILILNIR